MIALDKIELYRAEGPVDRLRKAGPFTDWALADGQLSRWAHTAPEPGNGYHKVDFKITWVDGETYEGRYDMNRWGEDSERDGHDLARHVRQFLTYLAHKPECPGLLKGNLDPGDEDTAAQAKAFIADRLPAESAVHPARKTFSCCKRTR
jgi:hypothetical protein